MITSLNWPTLEQRRNYFKLVMMQKITRALAVIPSLFLTPLSTITRGHMQRLTVPSVRVNSHLHSIYLPQPGKLWIRLPKQAGAQLLEHFRELKYLYNFVTTPTTIN